MKDNASFNRLTAVSSRIDNLQVGDISKISEEPSIITDSPFQVGDKIICHKITVLYLTNYRSKLGYLKDQIIEDETGLTTIVFKQVVSDDNRFTVYIGSLDSKKGYGTENMFLIFSKSDGQLTNKWVSVDGKKRIYRINWDDREDNGLMIHNKNQNHIKFYYWKKIN